jgi:Domain of unknown function (DUF4917)
MSRLGAFLRMQGCNGAQPDGKKIVDELLEHFRELAETDETGAAKVLKNVPDVISFDDAIKQTEGKNRAVLLGNGFSIQHFSYRTLLEKSGLTDVDPLTSLFKALGTYDFEKVIRALEDAAVVESAYGNAEQSDLFSKDADRLRQSLVNAVRTTHPTHRENIAAVIPSCIQFLKLFGKIFTLNYDLLLYWVILDDTKSFQDGFGLGDEKSGFLGPFKEGAYCNIYNVHGGLHLFRTAAGDVEKRVAGASGVIDAIAETITKAKRLPIYVAEGTTTAKLSRIRSIPYLKHCYDTIASSSGYFFVYGHSADPNDKHIYQALFNSKIERLYFCVHKPPAKLSIIDGELARYKKVTSSGVDYAFVDSESARVWNRPPKTK